LSGFATKYPINRYNFVWDTLYTVIMNAEYTLTRKMTALSMIPYNGHFLFPIL